MATSTAALPLAVDPTTRRLILLLPAALLAHDLGELAGNDQLNRAAHDLTRRFPIPAERALPHFTTSRTQATVAIGALAAGVTMLSWRAARSAPHSPTMTAYGAATLLLGAHMVPHTVAAIALRRWPPGLAGGLTITVPYSALMVRRLLRPRSHTWWSAGRRRCGPLSSPGRSSAGPRPPPGVAGSLRTHQKTQQVRRSASIRRTSRSRACTTPVESHALPAQHSWAMPVGSDD
jgi:hypothetical protein